MDAKEIYQDAQNVVGKLRDYSRSQVQTWKRIPRLALQSDGIGGFSEHKQRAYHSGFWGIYNNPSQLPTCSIDLDSGNIVNTYCPFTAGRPSKDALFFFDSPNGKIVDYWRDPSDRDIWEAVPAREDAVLWLALNMHMLDAKKIADELEKEGREPIHKLISDSNPGWKSEKRKLLENFPILYSRKKL